MEGGRSCEGCCIFGNELINELIKAIVGCSV